MLDEVSGFLGSFLVKSDELYMYGLLFGVMGRRQTLQFDITQEDLAERRNLSLQMKKVKEGK